MTSTQPTHPSDTLQMRAVGLSEYGGPEVLRVVRLPEPHAKAGQVRVRVRAAAVNPADVMLRDGRLASWYQESEPPHVPGMDLAGTVDEIGDAVDPSFGLAVGSDVVGVIDNRGQYGAYSQYVVIDARSVAAKPAEVDFEEAASFLMNALTAHSALDVLGLPSGSTLLVTGAAGAVGGYAVQLAAAAGLRVIAVASEQDERLVRSFGAQHLVLRDRDLDQQVRSFVPVGVDAVVDGAVLQDRIYPVIRDGGQIAAVIGGGTDPGRGVTVRPVNVRDHVTDQAVISELARRADAGGLALRVAARYPAENVSDAHTLFDQGGLRGRVVLQF